MPQKTELRVRWGRQPNRPKLFEDSGLLRYRPWASLRKSWGGKLSAPRTHTAVGRARPNGDRLRRGEGKFGWRREIERLVGLRRQFAIFSDPARQQSLGSFVNPLLEQCGDFFAQIGGVVQARKLEAFQGRG
jgi:hypothetical protein